MEASDFAGTMDTMVAISNIENKKEGRGGESRLEGGTERGRGHHPRPSCVHEYQSVPGGETIRSRLSLSTLPIPLYSLPSLFVSKVGPVETDQSPLEYIAVVSMMTTATVTYHELPPLTSWASDVANTVGGAVQPPNSATLLMPFFDPNREFGDSSSNWQQHRTVVGSETMEGLWTMPPPPPPSYGGQLTAMTVTSTSNTVQVAGGDFRSGGKKRTSIGGHCDGNNLSVRSTGGSCSSSSTSSTTLTSLTAMEELCLVCGDKASGYHYNALTCEGCKGFFRRSITRKAVYYCKYGGNCDIDMYMRRKCQCCRLRKCMLIGMRPERLRPDSRLPLVVIPEDQCRQKREAKMKMRSLNGVNSSMIPMDRKASCSPQQVTSTESPSDSSWHHFGLTLEQQELINRLIGSQQQFDMPTDDALSKLSTFCSTNTSKKPLPFQHLAELTIINVQLIVEFTKQLPGFSTLSNDDRRTLHKACATEVLMLRTAQRYDCKTDTIVLGNHTTSWAYNREAYKQAGIGSLTDAIFDFTKSMAKLRVDNAEYALLTAISIFSERPGLNEQKKVEDIQEVYTSALQAYIDVYRPKNRTVFARLLMKLTDLRTLGSEHADMLCALKIDGCKPTSLFACSSSSSSSSSPSIEIKLEPPSQSLVDFVHLTTEDGLFVADDHLLRAPIPSFADLGRLPSDQ